MARISRRSRTIGYSAIFVGIATVAGWIYVLSTPWVAGPGLRIWFGMTSFVSALFVVGGGVALLAIERYHSPRSIEQTLLRGGAVAQILGVLAVDWIMLLPWILDPATLMNIPFLDLLRPFGRTAQFLGVVLTVGGIVTVAVSSAGWEDEGTGREETKSEQESTDAGRTLLRIGGGGVVVGIPIVGLGGVLKTLSWEIVAYICFSIGWMAIKFGVPLIVLGGLISIVNSRRESAER